ncbi:hypothetical protein OB2597_06425 [Pseudooceanicola batsensis HTCC2597]|uniref:Uncharacterized protein n=1 Tax=Pseudooceanicola batsensis (strain ATCC BAA-863 / DSM 15984 / KCTC 12145 / HTCC2597) TaxID=252305 RepID=A3TTC0_PSEBH|nr:hypothetical protein [Pseudooceanicola batsensis]EAQ04897.1 hypothetical protein OB2597_06425 [Pseudooceanicola batsensis HTCC2597]
MRFFLTAATAALFLTTAAAEAGPVSRACLASDRGARNAQVCGCIQHVANSTLDWSDQRLVAKIFRKPQMAQDIKMSDSRQHEVFWKKYKAFGATASRACS